MVEVGIFGATGRVGKLLIDEILECKQAGLASVYVRNELHYNIPANTLVTSNMTDFLESSQVIIDFSSAEATKNLLEHARIHPTPLVIGTTGLQTSHMQLLEQCAKSMPILYATNMSEGVAMLNKLVALLGTQLRNYDIEITEIHHRHKKDAPSGTALTLAKTAATARNLDENVLKFGREGLALRNKDEIGVLSLRGGDVVGRHTVGFYADGEYIELTHNATSRATFAKGALHAALWLINQPSGLYSMQDIFEF
ncbi:4-hydroxy-tetrahydrodipicolinate reductase [Helicobacter trogontum]|uniref:4-hydroxy-tetrahydrodipicolinate reductase n=1 Tax=Helicobacter trogontum TaxID=50960 RepID=A0A4U8THI3_9HELI|nr:4-hydroxy-tetrahydrodipicolinate reductase [Helicobacter trogontum]MDY5184459.1 4-hydroxy-tetrahydrodipicolinate reductase [Helicobacter trogontum]TLD99700.1 4-hydroxy-tetrahydrodipicolinate reductase [Helicobacter trogontum]